MEDFFKVVVTEKRGEMTVRPSFQVGQFEDLLIRGKRFLAVWDEEKQKWSKKEEDVAKIVDRRVDEEVKALGAKWSNVKVLHVRDYETGLWNEFQRLLGQLQDSPVELDDKICFKSDPVRKEDHVTRALPYDLSDGECPAYDELVSTLYAPDERAKFEWAIGSILVGDSRSIQKFIVFYGVGGAGKSTMLHIIEKIFKGYWSIIDAKAITSATDSFATSSLRNNPFVYIQHDVDLSKINDNSILNSLVSHEAIEVNEKYKKPYMINPRGFVFLATNKPVKITDGKSGLIRRLIDIVPTGNVLEYDKYYSLYEQLDHELGAIAHRCINVYNSMGKNYYGNYKPLSMMSKTNPFFNFVEENYEEFKENDGISLKRAYDIYKQYCSDSMISGVLPKYKFKSELANYFEEFKDLVTINGERYKNYFRGFKSDRFASDTKAKEVFDGTECALDFRLADCPAQYASQDGTPIAKWDTVTTTLKELDTSRLHYVKPPPNHIVIDLDLKDSDGNKSLEKNIIEMRRWPPTYAEVSKSGHGIHMHYIYPGDPSELKPLVKENVEVKVFKGNSSLRRMVTKFNSLAVAVLSVDLPQKEEKKPMLDMDAAYTEKRLRATIAKALRKDVHPNTKSNVDFIKMLLDKAYEKIAYDVSDMRGPILDFASRSTNHAEYCVKLVSQMKFKSENTSSPVESSDDRIVFFDVEVFPNLFVIVWKFQGVDKCSYMINPTPEEVASLFAYKLVGFNNRRYDNHILYARYLGYSLEELYEYSKKIVGGHQVYFREAYGLSYADVYDYSSKKQSLKKFEIDLGIYHLELGLPWDKPVPEEKWTAVADYCCNDVIALEAVFNDRGEDLVVREMLAELSGCTVNDSNMKHISRIMFGDNKNPQSEFVYTDLTKLFPGYKFESGVSTFMGETVGEGGYVYAEPGMYTNIPVADVESMHPHSIKALNLFGAYTSTYVSILETRLAIKHKDFSLLDTLFDGKLKRFMDERSLSPKSVSTALKLILNSVYGWTFASFENPFRDPRNIDNIVAKRGALFMVMLKHEVQNRGFKVAHIKTDSIKIPCATPEIIEFVKKCGEEYGYRFEIEDTYRKMCLVNDAVYIAQLEDGKWEPTGAQFAHPVVFKALFSKEPIEFDDMCETKSVSGNSSIYLDYKNPRQEEDHELVFVGRVGRFTPVRKEVGAELIRSLNDKMSYVVGTKGYYWLESSAVKEGKLESEIDTSYFDELVQKAKDTIEEFGDFEWFVSDDDLDSPGQIAV